MVPPCDVSRESTAFWGRALSDQARVLAVLERLAGPIRRMLLRSTEKYGKRFGQNLRSSLKILGNALIACGMVRSPSALTNSVAPSTNGLVGRAMVDMMACPWKVFLKSCLASDVRATSPDDLAAPHASLMLCVPLAVQPRDLCMSFLLLA